MAVPVGLTGETINLISARINRNIEARNAEKARPYRISLSFGIVCYNPASPSTVDELLSEGDSLMYQQKFRKRQAREEGRKSLYFV